MDFTVHAALSFTTETELEKLPFVLLRNPENIAEIAKCADFHMNTPDGRRYGLFYRGGESILHFLEAIGILITNKDRMMSEDVAGMIVEQDSEEQPLIYRDFRSLVNAWFSLHSLHGVPIPEEEQDVLMEGRTDECDFSDLLLNHTDEENDEES